QAAQVAPVERRPDRRFVAADRGGVLRGIDAVHRWLDRHVKIELALHSVLQGVVELQAARREQLDAVVVERVVRRRDHRGRYTVGGGEPGDGRGRHDAEADAVDTPGGQPLEQRL